MKKILLMLAAYLIAVLTVKAQKITVLDSDGGGIPLATVLTEDGIIIGTTNLDGVLNDIKGAKRLVITHVAYKPQLVTVALMKDGKITMEDQNYGLTEITVTPKPYIYVETYYRVYVYRNDSLCYFLTGIMPNAIDQQTKKLQHGSYNHSYCEYAPKMGVAVNWGVRAQRFHAGQADTKGPTEKFMKEKYYTTATVKSPTYKVYSNPQGVVGNMITSGDQARMTLDAAKMQMYVNEVKGQKKLLEMRRKKDYQYQYTMIYNDDEDKGYDVADFVMETDHWEYNDKKSHVKLIIENYAVDHAYVNKEEWKAKKDELKQKYKGNLSLNQLEAYEKQHNIPALAPTVRQAIMKLKKQ